MNIEEKIKLQASHYPRVIRWSDEDRCFVGSLPDLCGDCTHGDTIEEVAHNLDECAELCIEEEMRNGEEIPPIRSLVIVPSAFRDTKNPQAIASLRRARGLSQDAFAKLLGVSISTLTKWEHGIRKPSGSSAKLLEIIKQHPELV